MGSPPWMPLYVGDFVADTMHLSATETGIYIRLLLHCWQHKTLPRDDRKLALIAHCDTRLWHRHKETVLQFFDLVNASTMQHSRVSTELLRSEEISNKRKEAAKQKHSKCSANALQMHTQSQSQSHKKEESILSPKPNGSDKKKISYSEEFEQFWQSYPDRRNNSKQAAFLEWLKLGPADRAAAAASLAAFSDYCRKHSDYRVIHCERYLKHRRFETQHESEPRARDGRFWIP